jgi:hypothetical protein
MAPSTAGLRLVVIALYAAANAAFAFWFTRQRIAMECSSSWRQILLRAIPDSQCLELWNHCVAPRTHWARLRVSQILVATFFAAALIIAITMVCVFVFRPFVERSQLV